MADHNISINILANGIQETVSLLKEIRDDIKTINSTPVTVKVNTAAATRSLNELRSELSAIANFISNGNRNNSDAMIEAFGSGVEEIIKRMATLGEMSVAPSIDTTSIDEATASMDEAASMAERLAAGLDIASSITGSMSSVFSGMGDFAGGIADAFEGMNSVFKFDALGTAKRYLTAMGTRAITGQISGIIQRYDIMNTFEDYMELAGVSSARANASLNAVDQSIRGIPIGLDEAAFRLRKYQMYLNDIDRATNFTIGIQKAITAGGASEQMKTTAYTQIDRLLATGKLGQSRQWLSLFNGLGVSLRFLREELALDPTADLKAIASDLADGTIATEDFIDAIARLADNEGLDKALEIYKSTIEAWQSNINNAVKRGGQKIMESVNDVMESTYGTGITGVMKYVRDQIDTVSLGASTYIRENPQNAVTIGNAVTGVVERMSGLDASGFASKTIERIGDLFDAMFEAFDRLPPGALEDFTSFAVTWAGPMATLMKAAQSGLPAMLGVFERFKDFDMGMLMRDIVTWGGRFADVIAKILGVIPDSALSNLIAFGLVWGKPVATALGAISGALKNISSGLTAGSFGEANGIFGQLAWLTVNHPIIMGALAAVTGIAIAVHNARENYKELSQEMLDKSGYSEIAKNIDDLVQSSTSLLESFETSTLNYKKDVDAVRQNALDASELLHTILETDKQINESIANGENYDDLYAQQITNIEKLKAIMPSMADLLGLDTEGRLENVAALEAQGDAYIELVKKQAEAEAMRSQLEKAFETKWEAAANRREAERQQKELTDSYKDALKTYKELKVDKGMETLTEGEYNRLVAAESIINNYRGDRDALWGAIVGYAKTENLSQEQIDYLAEKVGVLGRETQQIVQNGDVDQITSEIEGTGEQAENTVKQLTALTDAYDDIVDRSKKIAKASSEVKEQTQGLINKYKEAKESAQQFIDTALAGFEKIEAAGPEVDKNGNPKQTEDEWLADVWGGMLGGEKSQTLEAGRYKYAIDTIDEWYSGLDAETRKRYAPMVEEIVSSPWDNRDLAMALADKIKNLDVDSIMDLANEMFEEAGLKSGISDTIAHIMTMDEVEGDSLFGGLVDTVTAGLLQVLGELTENAGEEGELGKAASDFTDHLLKPFQEGLVGGGEASEGEGGVVGMFKDAMDNVQESANDLAAKVADALAPIVSGFDESTDGAHLMEAAIGNLATSASGKVGEMGSFAGSLDSVASSAFSAFSAVSNLAGAINNLRDKEINIRVNISAGLGMFGKGGMAGYYASGGNVLEGFPGMGSGSDIIPAWLTPGEYVMKRSAVGLFGTRLMDRINKMDIGGAFDALMSRISNPMMHGNTYNRDNHAQVNNYFYGNSGQDYSQRKAYRYVGGL